MTMIRRLILAVGIALISVGAGQSANAQADQKTVIANTVFVSESGKQVRLGDYRGKNVLVYFWASWYPH